MTELIDFLNKYVKRKNLIEDFVELTQKSGIDHRFSGKGSNASDKKNVCLTDTDIKEICDGSEKFIAKFQEAINQARIKLQENATTQPAD